MTAPHPLAALTATEASLVASIQLATARLNAVATTSLDDALTAYRAAARAARDRLAVATRTLAVEADNVLGDLLQLALEIEAACGKVADPQPASFVRELLAAAVREPTREAVGVNGRNGKHHKEGGRP